MQSWRELVNEFHGPIPATESLISKTLVDITRVFVDPDANKLSLFVAAARDLKVTSRAPHCFKSSSTDSLLQYLTALTTSNVTRALYYIQPLRHSRSGCHLASDRARLPSI